MCAAIILTASDGLAQFSLLMWVQSIPTSNEALPSCKTLRRRPRCRSSMCVLTLPRTNNSSRGVRGWPSRWPTDLRCRRQRLSLKRRACSRDSGQMLKAG